MKKIAVLVGSLRKESFSRKVAKNVMDLFPNEYETEIIPIGDLALYNQDFDDDENHPPQSWTNFRKKVKEFEAVLFVTPEYNRSIPGVLKNALDVGSRPMEDSVWKGKPAAVISNSPKNLSGFGANHHLRQSLVFFDMPVVQQPEVYLANVATLLDEGGKINNDDTIQFLQSFVDTFVKLIKQSNR